ncbi:TetR/AcrR family transcriptional regulator [Hwanghaeella sp.]|uniref:TetR/AcrR family transcriptional regulator n=1 Tax=Hwanghaeella sp. TaxID=2605943 RepID=UPI003CCBC3B5
MSESKRDQLIQRALSVFYKDGFHAVGMDKIAKETGVSKTAIYKHFRTKDDLILATLRLRDEQFRNWIIRRIEEIAEDPAERILASFDALKEWFLEPTYLGCMFIKASSEFQERDSSIHAICAEHKRILERYLIDLAEKAGARNPDQLGAQILLLQEGAIVVAALMNPEKAVSDAKAAAATLLEQALSAA